MGVRDWKQAVCEPMKCSENNIKICADHVEFKIENVQFLEELREKREGNPCAIFYDEDIAMKLKQNIHRKSEPNCEKCTFRFDIKLYCLLLL